jgi:hypothetical protein
LHRAGELVAIRVPTVQEEAVRDLWSGTCAGPGPTWSPTAPAPGTGCAEFLLRHGRAWRGGNAWTLTHERWLLAQRFEEPALAATYAHYRAVLDARDAQLKVIEADLAGWYDRAPFADAVHRLAADRGITRLGVLTLASEVGDWRRFPRAAAFTGFAAWCPRSIPAAARPGGATSPSVATSTCAPSWPGSAWSYQYRPAVGADLRERQQGLDPQVVARAWAAQLRLGGRFGPLAARKDSKNLVVTAIAREFTGFLWAEIAA